MTKISGTTYHIISTLPGCSHLQPQIISKIMSGYNDFRFPYQSSQSTHTTMSSLTTLGPGIVSMDGDDKDDVVETEAPL